MGSAMTIAGAAITAALVLSVKSAAEEEKGIIKLSKALENVGVDYNVVKKSLEGVIKTTQQKTAFSDDQQRASLQALLEVTGDYKKSLDLLPLALDLARAKGMDAASASQIIGKVAQGNTSILVRYGIVLKEGATATEALGELQKKFGGQAEAYGKTMSGQMAILKNTIGDVMESIGSQLIPILTDLLKRISPAIEKIQDWIEANPELAKTIIITVAAIGGLLAIMGPLLIMLPALTAGVAAFGVALHVAMGPVGWIALAVMGLAAAAILLASNWERITNPLAASIRKQTEIIKTGLAEQKFAIIANYATLQAAAKTAHDKAVQAIKDEYGLSEQVTKDKIKLANEAYDNEIKRIDGKAAADQRVHDQVINNINTEYGEGVGAAKSQTQIARAVRDTRIQALNDEADTARRVHQERLSQFEQEYNLAIKNLYAASGIETDKLQAQIDAIDAQTQAEDRASQVRSDQERVDVLQSRIDDEENAQKKWLLEQEFSQLLQDIRRRDLLWNRDAEKNALRDKIQAVRDGADAEALTLRQAADKKIELAGEVLKNALGNITTESAAAETALTESLGRISKERDEKILAENAVFDVIQSNSVTLTEQAKAKLTQDLYDIDSVKTALILREEITLAAALAAIAAKEKAEIGSAERIAAAKIRANEWVPPPTSEGRTVPQPFLPPVTITPFAGGGMIPDPTWLTRVGESSPYGIMAEKRPEFIVPQGSASVVVTGNTFNVRQQSDIDKIAEAIVSRIRLQQGVKI